MHTENMHCISLLPPQLALFPGGKASAPGKIQKVHLKGWEALSWSKFLQGPVVPQPSQEKLMELQMLPGDYPKELLQDHAPALPSIPQAAQCLGTFPIPLSKPHMPGLTADSFGSLIPIHVILW